MKNSIIRAACSRDYPVCKFGEIIVKFLFLPEGFLVPSFLYIASLHLDSSSLSHFLYHIRLYGSILLVFIPVFVSFLLCLTFISCSSIILFLSYIHVFIYSFLSCIPCSEILSDTRNTRWRTFWTTSNCTHDLSSSNINHQTSLSPA